MKIGNNDVCSDSPPAILRTIRVGKNLAGQHPLVQSKQRAVLKQEARADQYQQIESRNEAQYRVQAAHPGTASSICRCRPDSFRFRTLRRSKSGLIAFLTQGYFLANDL